MGHGVVAVGDSVINGGVRPARTAALSWAQWLAQAGDLAFTKYAKGGATSADVVECQLQRIVRDYDIGCVSVGANDVLLGWDATTYAANLRTIARALRAVAPTVLVTNLPATFRTLPGVDLTAAVTEANRIVGDVCQQEGVTPVDISDLRGGRLMRPDRVHPTSVGLTEIAARAARLVGIEPEPVNDQPLGLRLGAMHAWGTAVETGRVNVKRLLGC